MPGTAIIAAQVVIGLALGARLDARRLAGLPRTLAAGLATAALMVAITVLLGGALMPLAVGIPMGAGMLGAAPGGLAEMIAASKALDLLPATVAGFQITRSVLTNALVSQLVLRMPA